MPRLPATIFGWVLPIFRLGESELVALAGTDAAVFLMFMRMLRWIFTVIAVLCCVVLIPVDAVYSSRHRIEVPAGENSNTQNFLSTSLAGVDGDFLWAHVVLEYIVTLIVLVFLWMYYRSAIRLRQEFFMSDQYQKSFSSRTLLVTNINPKLQSDASLRNALENTSIPYPLIEVQNGNDFGDLPNLLERQHELVMKLENVLNRYLSRKHTNCARPQIVLDKTNFGMCGGRTVDAIDHYGSELVLLEDHIDMARKELHIRATTSYGFASVAAPQYAHTAARLLHHKHPMGLSVRLAPFPRDLIWRNLSLSRKQRQRLQVYGFFLCVLLFAANLFPMVATSFLSNLELFSTLIPFLRKWHDASIDSFAAVSGLLPPIISVCFALLLPRAMRQIVIYQGVRTRELRDLALCGQYFLFLFLTQFVLFTMMGVGAAAALSVKGSVERHDSAGAVVDNLTYSTLNRIASQLPVQSVYWISWSTVRTYMICFELAQIVRMVLNWAHKHIYHMTPRRAQMLSKPPQFDYWCVYPEMMFAAAIGIIYSCLAPLVTVFIAAMFWLASLVYKYQLLYVYTTKSETGGRLWQVVINRILVALVLMQVIIALIVGLKVSDGQNKWNLWSWIKSIACLPPCAAVLAFKLYCRTRLDNVFRWYDPSPLDLAQTTVAPLDTQPHLERQFGHPFLHDPLWIPIVAAEYMPMVKHVYGGAVQSSRHQDRTLEQDKTDSTSSLDKCADLESVTGFESGKGYLPANSTDIEMERLSMNAPSHRDFYETESLPLRSDAYEMDPLQLRHDTSEPESLSLVHEPVYVAYQEEPTENLARDIIDDDYAFDRTSKASSFLESDVLSCYAAMDK